MAAKYLIDSDICINVMRKRGTESLKSLMSRIAPEGLAISVITYGEVSEGILFSKQRALNAQLWKDFLRPFDILNITPAIAEIWAEVRGTLRAAGRIVPDNDLLIAATGLFFDLTVVTLNERHFSRVAGLDLLVPTVSA